MRKLFGKKNILSLIFGLLMMLPFFSIMARCIYVQSNPNAYESYSGTSVQYQKQLKYQTNDVNNADDLIEGNIYDLYFIGTSGDFYEDFGYVYFTLNYVQINIPIDYLPTLSTDELFIEEETYNILRFETNLNDGDITLVFYQSLLISNDEYLITCIISSLTYNPVSYVTFIYNSDFETDLNLLNSLLQNGFIKSSNYQEYEYVEIESSTLDNVFDYSLASFVEDNNFGIDFFQWFDDTFLNQSGHNMIYLNFANWYLNYAMIVSTAYILFLAMIWFVYFARSLFEKFMNYDGGGF